MVEEVDVKQLSCPHLEVQSSHVTGMCELPARFKTYYTSGGDAIATDYYYLLQVGIAKGTKHLSRYDTRHKATRPVRSSLHLQSDLRAV